MYALALPFAHSQPLQSATHTSGTRTRHALVWAAFVFSHNHDAPRMHMLRSIAFTLFLLSIVVLDAEAQQHVTYDVSFPNIVHHEAEITITFTGASQRRPLEVRMSRTSPGRYALHEFAKNVYNVRAVDGTGKALSLTRPNPHQWDVAGHNGTVQLSYTLFADHADGTYTGLDDTHAHMNMPATFMWARGLEEAPIEITFNKPHADWQVATQLLPTDDPDTFTAPDLMYFLDSPTEISAFSLRTWDVSSNNHTYTIRLAVHHAGTEEEVDDYAEDVKKVVAEQISVYGETPDYESGNYTFIACYLPYVDGDGMEHRNSTILTSTSSLATNALGLLGTVSHEYFHQWNVERLRPASLEPFDFEAANMSEALWFAEGFTSYYTGYMIRRAGIIDDSLYANSLSNTVNTVTNAPGRRFFSAAEMSMRAPFVDAATSVDPTSFSNTFISYYTWGSAIGLGLDLTLRSRFNTTLDTYMRTLWTKYGKPERPYELDDLKTTLGDVAGDHDFANDFFARYIEGREIVDYEALLGLAGFLVQPTNPGSPWLGADIEDDDDGATLDEYPTLGSPLYDAGLTLGDIIFQLGDFEIENASQVEAFLAANTSASLPIRFRQRGVEKEATLVLTDDPQVKVVRYEDAGRTVTDAMRAFRADWLGSQAQ